MRKIPVKFVLASAAAALWLYGIASAGETPRRIISHMPSVTEICFTLGIGDRIVGVSDFCHYPPEAKDKTKIGGVMNPDFETILSLEPDLAILMDNQRDLRARYRAAGIKVLPVKSETVNQVFDSITTIGKATGTAERANLLVGRIRSDLEEVRRLTKGKRHVQTLIVVWHDPGSLQNLYVAGPGTFLDTMLKTAGGVNCVQALGSPFAKISKEELLKINPEAVLYITTDESFGEKEEQAEREIWSSLEWIRAVKKGNVHVIAGEYAHTPGPRMTLIARRMALALHPDLGGETGWNSTGKGTNP